MDRALAHGLGSIEGVAARATDLTTLWSGVARVLTPLIPNHMGPCCFTLDPASLLMTSHVNPALSYRLPHEMLRDEYAAEDVHDMAGTARSRTGVSTLHDATGGDPSHSPRWRANMRMGADQELLLALRTRAGVTWGCLGLYRAPGQPRFDERETGFLRAISAPVAEGVRRALLLGEAREPESPAAPGLLLVTPSLEVESATAAGERWLDELPGAGPGVLPAAVMSVAGTVFAAGTATAGPRWSCACARGRAPGWCCTARAWRATGRPGPPSSSSPRIRRASARC